MNNRDYELLSAYIDGALSRTEQATLEQRLETEPGLRRELQSLQQTVLLLRQMPGIHAPRDFTLTPQMVGQRAPTPQVLPFPLTATFSALSAAAAVMLFVFGGYFLLRMNTMPLTSTTAAFQPQTTGLLAEVEPTGVTVVALASTASPAPTLGAALNAAPPAELRSTDAEALQPDTLEQAQASGEVAPAVSAPAQLNAQEEAEADGSVLLYRGTEEPLAPAPEMAADSAMMDEAASQVTESPASSSQDAAANTVGGSPGSGFGGASASEVSKAAPTSQPSLALRAENTLEKQGTPVADGLLHEVGSDPFRDRQAMTPGPGLDPIGLALLAAGILLLGTAIASTLFRRRRLQE